MKPKIDYTIYLVTDNELKSTETLEEAVELAIQGGCTLVQLREKELETGGFYRKALSIKAITDRYNIPLIINDRVDIALAVNAAGVHIGQSDIPADVVRRLIGDDMILGVSTSTLAEALQAEKDGADYLGVGAMFDTSTKENPPIVSKALLNEIISSTHISIVAIGGINKATLPLLAGTKIAGISVVSAILSQKDIISATKTLKEIFRDCSIAPINAVQGKTAR